MNFFTKPRIICWLLLSFIVGVLFVSYMISPKQARTLLYFPQGDGGVADPELLPRSCFVRDNALYVDLPAQILTPSVKTPDFYTVYTLFLKNIAVNCKYITAVYFYVDGVPIYVKNSHISTDNKKS